MPERARDRHAPRRLSFGARLGQLAAAEPDRTVLVYAAADGGESSLSRGELERGSNRAARLLAARGLGADGMLVVALRNSPEHVLFTLGGWKLGACVLPLSPKLPVAEREALLEVARPAVVVAEWEEQTAWPVVRPGELGSASGLSDEALPDRTSEPGKAIASGGSTGRPKIIVDPSPWARVPGAWVTTGLGTKVGMRAGQVQIVAGPLYHNAPFTWSHLGLFEEHTLVLMERFDAARFVALVERHRVNFGFLVPTMMQRIARLPGVRREAFESVHAFFHSGGPCAAWLKEAWIDLVGGERVYDAFGATEAVGITIIRGDEWLEHRGSVGRPVRTELRILDDAGRELPPGEVGEIFTRPEGASGPTYRYLGAPPAATTPDGFVSVGDMGWVDADGYLFLADRRADLILSGGANVYPAEVEGVLSQHPEVEDVVVVGVPDEEWGSRVHAIVRPRAPERPPSPEVLDRHCRERLVSYKVPRSYEFVSDFPREESGKVRRARLAEERGGPARPGDAA